MARGLHKKPLFQVVRIDLSSSVFCQTREEEGPGEEVSHLRTLKSGRDFDKVQGIRRGTVIEPTFPDPTPEEIRQRCWEVQAGWSEREEHKRRSWSA